MAKDSGSFVDALVKDPANPPKVRLIAGYVGSSNMPGHVRIYANPELSAHIDVPESAVLHSQPIQDDPLGAKYIWVDREADVTRRDSNQVEMRAKFLSGPLAAAQANMAGGVAAGAGGAAGAPGQAVAQVSLGMPCPTPTFLPNQCPSNLGVCPSIDTACVSMACITQGPPECPVLETRVPILCPTRNRVECFTMNTPCISQVIICQTRQALCPTRPVVCRTLAGSVCPTNVQIFCPIRTLNEPACGLITQQGCFTLPNCPTLGACPSAVDACPSALQCPPIDVTFNPLM